MNGCCCCCCTKDVVVCRMSYDEIFGGLFDLFLGMLDQSLSQRRCVLLGCVCLLVGGADLVMVV